MVDEKSPVDKLTEAIQQFLVESSGENVLLDQAVLLYEGVRLDPDTGEPFRRIRYAVLGNHGSISGAIGLVSIGAALIEQDTLPDLDNDDEEGE